MSMPPYDVSADGPMAAAAAASAATAASNTPTRTGSPSQHHMHHHHHHSHQNHNHHHSSHPSSSSTPIPTSSSPSSSHDHPPSHNPQQPSSKLKLEEQRIDLKVRHHLNRDDHRKKQKRFKRTVMTVHAIVSLKLYKSKASSLEAYFRDAWKISRAQVYRFLDCAVVLNTDLRNNHAESDCADP
ncbi:hypothetical protein DFS34DRAFT_240023 [Phlyctochytrium arcticum]|nr:hypothetical protein DFS34DRAFT_240023 [Phlyctochytrium arcticum]